MARTRRASRRGRAVSRKSYRARGGELGERQIELQLEYLESQIKGFRNNRIAGGKKDVLQQIMIRDFKTPIMQSIHVNTDTKKKEIERVIDNFINIWLSNKDVTGVWGHLIRLLFPGKYREP